MRLSVLILILATGIWAQAPKFEVASIKPDSDPGKAGILRPSPGTLTAQNVSVKSYIQWAWNVKEYQILVPTSLQAAAESHYDIVARTGGPEPPDQLRLMLQSLLTERFRLAIHFEKKELSVFALVVANGGPRGLHEPAPDSVPHMEPDSSTEQGGQRWQFHNMPVSALMGIMSNGLSRPFVDMTGIHGSFDFTFLLPKWNREDGPLGDHVVSNVFPELQRQLGLRVQGATAN